MGYIKFYIIYVMSHMANLMLKENGVKITENVKSYHEFDLGTLRAEARV